MTTAQDWRYAWDVLLMLGSAIGAGAFAWLFASTWPRFCRHRHSILRRNAEGVAGLECVKCGLWVADPRDHRVPWPARREAK